jgi:sodium/bile acid cotransporter 7
LPPALPRLLADNYVPLALTAAMALGAAYPKPGLWAADRLGVTSLATAGIFLISVLGVRGEQALRALRAWREVAFGLLSILFITPLLAAPLAAALPLEPRALATGLAVFFCMPTTLSSGVALTAVAGGDAALALLLTVSSNFLGTVTAPWAVAKLLSGVGGGGLGGETTAASIDPVPLLRSLAKTVAAPLVVGSALRSLPLGNHAIARAVDANRTRLAYVSTALLALVPWSQVSRAVAGGAALRPAPLAAAAAAGLAIHVGLLLFNLAAVRALDLGRGGGGGGGCGGGSGGRKKGVGDAERQEQEQEQALFGARVALVLCCSQKALAVAVPVVAALFASSSSSSLSSSTLAATASIPIVILHMLQTAFDGLVAARVAKRREREKKRKEQNLSLSSPKHFFS